MRSTIFVLMLFMTHSFAGQSQTHAEEKILDILDRQVKAWNNGDLDGFKKSATPLLAFLKTRPEMIHRFDVGSPAFISNSNDLTMTVFSGNCQAQRSAISGAYEQ